MLRKSSPLLIVAAGVLLRALHLLSWDVPKGFDFTEHWKYILFLLSTGRVPLARDVLPPAIFHGLHIGDGAFRASYHPPLFYWLGHFLVPHAAEVPLAQFRVLAPGHPACSPFLSSPEIVELARRVAWISVAAGAARLLLLERYLALAFPGEGALLGRSLAVGLAAILPCALRMDQTVSPESLVATLIAAAMYLVLLSLRQESARRQVAFAAAAGLAAGFAMLAKYTGLVAVGTVGVSYAGQWLFAPARRGRALLSLGAGLALTAAVAGGYYQRNRRVLGKAFPDSYDYSLAWEKTRVRTSSRDLAWYVPFQPAVLVAPYWSDFWKNHPNYWSQMYATAWGDFFSTRFLAHDVGENAGVSCVNGRAIPLVGVASTVALMWLALPPTIALFWGLLAWIRRSWHERAEAYRVALPACAAAFGALAVAFVNTVKNAIESDGPTKSEYALAATPILCAVAAFALAAAWRRWPRLRWALALDLGLLGAVIVLQSLVL